MYGDARQSVAGKKADFHPSLIGMSFIQLLCSFALYVNADKYATMARVFSQLNKLFLTFSFLDILRSFKVLCSAFLNHKPEECNPKFQQEMECIMERDWALSLVFDISSSVLLLLKYPS